MIDGQIDIVELDILYRYFIMYTDNIYILKVSALPI